MMEVKADTAILEWEGEEYEINFHFGLARSLRSRGVNILSIYRQATAEGGNLFDFADDVALAISLVLTDAGAKDATEEKVFAATLSSEKTAAAMSQFFMWMCVKYFQSSPMAPKGEEKKARPRAAKKKS